MYFKLLLLTYFYLVSTQIFSAENCYFLASSFHKQDRYERVLKMKSRYVGEASLMNSNRPVRYLDSSERKLRIFGLKNNIAQLGGENFKCEKSFCEKIFVMSPFGEIYIGDSGLNRFHHSSFLAGKPVAAAGNLKVKKSQIIYLDNLSGHYRPEAEHTFQVIEQLLHIGFEIPDRIRIALLSNHVYVDLNYKEVVSAHQAGQIDRLISDETDYIKRDDLKEMGRMTILKYIEFLEKFDLIK